MQENLLSPTNIHLFGRLFPLTVDQANLPAALGANQFLRNQLNQNAANNDAQFARIYAISYEGTFYNLPKPAVYLVHGPGRTVGSAGKTRQTVAAAGAAAAAVTAVLAAAAPGAHPNAGAASAAAAAATSAGVAGAAAAADAAGAGVPAANQAAVQAAAEAAAIPPTITDSGVVAEEFDLESDVRVWEYDKGDFTLRIDIASGTFDEILLEAALSVTARDALVSRSDLTSRSDLASRSDLTSRSDVTSRSDLTARHRLKG
jgi:hypothetical protein